MPLSCGSTSRHCSRRAGWSPGCTTPGRAAARSSSSWRSTRPASARRSRSPASPGRHTPLTEPWFDRLHFLVWANNYDARSGEPVWWWVDQGVPGRRGRRRDRAVARRARRRAPAPTARRCGSTAVRAARRLPARCWCMPSRSSWVRHPRPRSAGAGRRPRRRPTRRRGPRLAAPARIIAPAGSGKTRVLTARLRHLVGRPRCRARHRARRRLQQAGPAGDGAAHA